MLDEFREFEQYISPLNSEFYERRLKIRTLGNNLSGTPRAMTIIARRYLDGDNRPEKIRFVTNILQAWCGDPKGDPEQVPKEITPGWLPAYIQRLFARDKARERTQELKGRFGRDGYNARMFPSEVKSTEDTEKNDFKKITYEHILSDALTLGPLRRYYLVCEKDDLADISYDTGSKIVFPFAEGRGDAKKEKNTGKNKEDLIGKTISAVLLEQNGRNAENPYEGYVPVNKTDLLNWLVTTPSDLNDRWSRFGIDSRPLFALKSSVNTAAVAVDSEWMKDCGWKVIEERQLDEYLQDHPGGVFFRDDGAGRYLRRYSRYGDKSDS